MKRIKVFHALKPGEMTSQVNQFIEDNDEYMNNVKLNYLQSSASVGSDKASTWITVIVEYDYERDED